MNHKAISTVLASSLICAAFGLLTSCSGGSPKTITPPPVPVIAVTNGSGQSATVSTAFAAPLVAKVTTGGIPTAGVGVGFTAPGSGASGTFSGGNITETDITDANGVATSTTFTANATAGGPYVVAATVVGASAPANFSLTNTSVVSTVTNYTFYAGGLEAINGGPNNYSIAGAVSVDSTGAVLGGEQDYNNGFTVTSPQPSGDLITGGNLTVDPTTGQGTLTLITDNVNVGVTGTETFGVQFANVNHALIVQFDGTATSSGSMDVQISAGAPAGNFAYILSGVDPNASAFASGGVFTITGTTLSNGIADLNDNGLVATNNAFSGTVSAPDAFGRGTITGLGLALNYYVVGPEALRIIDVDTGDAAVGSAFGQGANAYSNASLGSSVFGVETSSYGFLYAGAGMFSTVPGSGTFQGLADDDEQGNVVSASAISGTYAVTNSGYGSMTINNNGLGNISLLGIYMTDPTLNLNDPNDPSGGGGALVLDLDALLAGGTGVIVPATDTSTGSFTGNYAFAAQDYNGVGLYWEFDLVGQGLVTAGTLAGTGLASDPFEFFDVTPALYSGVSFAGTATPDALNPGRYTMPLTVTAIAGTPVPLQVAIYQASGGQLFWLEEDNFSLFLGPIQQQGPLTGLPASRRHAAKTRAKPRR